MGPATLGTTGFPLRELASPLYEKRPELGFSPNRWLKAEGIRMEPPMSVPMPKTEPREARRDPSPPELPPGDSRRLWGFKPGWCKLDCNSPIIKVCGTWLYARILLVSPA